MPSGVSLTEKEKKKILSYHKRNYSQRKIAANLKRSQTLISHFLRDPSKYGTKLHTGRKTKVTPRVKRLIINKSSNSSISAKQIIKECDLNISKATVNRVRADCPHLLRAARIK